MSDNVMNFKASPHQPFTEADSSLLEANHSAIYEMAGAGESPANALSDSRFHQKAKIMGALTHWLVPQVVKYAASEAADVSPAGKYHTMLTNQIQRHWRLDVATNCLPEELQALTWWSLSFESRLGLLASLTAQHHGKAIMLMRQMHAERRAKEAALGGEYLSPTISTIPVEIGKQVKKRMVEATIQENRAGLTLEDVNYAVEACQRAEKKVRFMKAPGETKKEMSSRVKKESRRAKKGVQKIMRGVLNKSELAEAPRKRIFKEIQTSVGRPLRKAERRDVTKIQKEKAATGSKSRGITYSLAASGPAGSLIIVNGLDPIPEVDMAKEKQQTELALRPGLSEMGSKFLVERGYIDAKNATVISPGKSKTNDMDSNADQEPSPPAGSDYGAKRRSRELSTLLSRASVSPSSDSDADADEAMANTGVN